MTWYDPQEIKDQADGSKVQPEFAPEATEGYEDVDGKIMRETTTALIDRADAIAQTIADEITNGPEATF